MAESDKNGLGNFLVDILRGFLKSQSENMELCQKKLIEKDALQEEADPETVYLTRAWLLKHGWEPTKDYPLFQGSSEYIDPDLCVVIDRKDYMVAKFHYMGDDAWNPSAKPYSFEIVGVNNFTEMLDYDHTRLVMAAYVCHLTGFKEIDNAIGGVYEMTMTKKD